MPHPLRLLRVVLPQLGGLLCVEVVLVGFFPRDSGLVAHGKALVGLLRLLGLLLRLLRLFLVVRKSTWFHGLWYGFGFVHFRQKVALRE